MNNVSHIIHFCGDLVLIAVAIPVLLKRLSLNRHKAWPKKAGQEPARTKANHEAVERLQAAITIKRTALFDCECHAVRYAVKYPAHLPAPMVICALCLNEARIVHVSAVHPDKSTLSTASPKDRHND